MVFTVFFISKKDFLKKGVEKIKIVSWSLIKIYIFAHPFQYRKVRNEMRR